MSNSTQERRQYRRLDVGPSVILRTFSGKTVTGRMVNLSSGGALIDLKSAPPAISPQEPITLTIQWTHPSVAWVADEKRGGKVRHQEQTRLGISFDEPRPAPV